MFFVFIIPVIELFLCLLLLLWWLTNTDFVDLRKNRTRFLTVLIVSLILSMSSGIISVVISTLLLPLNDGAHGLGFRILIDPFILMPVLLVTIPIGVILAPYYFVCTMNVKLVRCAIAIQTLALVVVALTSFATPFAAMVVSIPTVVVSLYYCGKCKYLANVAPLTLL